MLQMGGSALESGTLPALDAREVGRCLAPLRQHLHVALSKHPCAKAQWVPWVPWTLLQRQLAHSLGKISICHGQGRRAESFPH